MANEFLPEGYAVQGGSYMKFVEGDNRFRILSKPVLGYELWIEGKPKRVRMGEAFTQEDLDRADVSTYNGKKRTPSHFWAMTVWNYKQKQVQILEINQVSILRDIKALSDDADWGNPMDYDLNVIRKQENQRTRYTTTPKPKKELAPDVAQAFKDTPMDLEALFVGSDPYAAKPTEKAPMNESVSEETIPF